MGLLTLSFHVVFRPRPHKLAISQRCEGHRRYFDLPTRWGADGLRHPVESSRYTKNDEVFRHEALSTNQYILKGRIMSYSCWTWMQFVVLKVCGKPDSCCWKWNKIVIAYNSILINCRCFCNPSHDMDSRQQRHVLPPSSFQYLLLSFQTATSGAVRKTYWTFSGPVYSSLREPVGITPLFPIQRIYINASVATKGLDGADHSTY